MNVSAGFDARGLCRLPGKGGARFGIDDEISLVLFVFVCSLGLLRRPAPALPSRVANEAPGCTRLGGTSSDFRSLCLCGWAQVLLPTPILLFPPFLSEFLACNSCGPPASTPCHSLPRRGPLPTPARCRVIADLVRDCARGDVCDRTDSLCAQYALAAELWLCDGAHWPHTLSLTRSHAFTCTERRAIGSLARMSHVEPCGIVCAPGQAALTRLRRLLACQ